MLCHQCQQAAQHSG